MAAIKVLRETLAGELADALGVPVDPAWPVQINPPCAFLTPSAGSSYVVAGKNFGEYTVAVDVVLMVEHGAVEDALVALEALVEVALVNSADWVLDGVDSPAPTSVTESGAEYLASVMHLRKFVQLT
ncbi:MAG TPA: hypothetical protein VK453_24330 [Micromonosporaceae bacterium]|nr:hypothetical protein [Micromonosporaceae bacterium]